MQYLPTWTCMPIPLECDLQCVQISWRSPATHPFLHFCPMPVGKPLLYETVLQLFHKQMDIPFELLRVFDASSGQVVIDPILSQLFDSQLSHPALCNRDLLRRVISINLLKTIGSQFLQVELVFALLVEDEVQELLRLVGAVHEGPPEEALDGGDAGLVQGEWRRLQDMFNGDNKVFLIVVIGARRNLSLILCLFLREFKYVDKITLRWLPCPEGAALRRSLGGGLAQGLELHGFHLSAVIVLNGKKLINRFFNGFFSFFGQETVLVRSFVLETLKQPHFLHVVILLHSNQNYQYKALKKCVLLQLVSLLVNKYNKYRTSTKGEREGEGTGDGGLVGVWRTDSNYVQASFWGRVRNGETPWATFLRKFRDQRGGKSTSWPIPQTMGLGHRRSVKRAFFCIFPNVLPLYKR